LTFNRFSLSDGVFFRKQPFGFEAASGHVPELV